MAIYKQGILGSFSGKVGTVVGSSWRGIAYIRSLATKVSNPRTPAQQESRNRLSKVTSMLRSFTPAIRKGFVGTGSVSPWSAAIKANYSILSSSDADFDWSKLALSNGDGFFEMSVEGSGTAFSFNWSAPLSTSEFNDGQLFVGAYNQTTGKGALLTADLTLESFDADFSSLSKSDTDVIHVFYIVTADDASTPTQMIA